MKFLQLTVLSALVAGCVTASTFDQTDLGMAIKEGDLDTAVTLYRKDMYNQDEGIKYVIENMCPDFIASFLQSVNSVCGRTLAMLYEKRSGGVVEEVLEKIKFSQEDIALAASRPNTMLSPKKFIDLYRKLDSRKDQDIAFAGIKILSDNYSTRECIDPLLREVEETDLLSDSAKEVPIHMLFMHDPVNDTARWGKRFCNYSEITCQIYAKRLFLYGKFHLGFEAVKLLFAEADKADLQALKDMDGYMKKMSEFRTYIDTLMSEAAPGGSRYRQKFVERMLEKISSPFIPRVVCEMVGDYVGKDVAEE